MSSLVPTSAAQSAVATAAQAAVRRIDPPTALPSGDGRGGARARGDVEALDRRPTQAVLPAGRNDSASRDSGRALPHEIPSYWPTAAYFVQHLSQEAIPDDSPTIGHRAGTAKYPSLALDSDIFLPGEAIASRSHADRRVDIIV